MEEEYDNWDYNLVNDLEIKLKELRRFNATLERSPEKEVENITLEKHKLKLTTIVLVADQI